MPAVLAPPSSVFADLHRCGSMDTAVPTFGYAGATPIAVRVHAVKFFSDGVAGGAVEGFEEAVAAKPL